MNKEPNESRNSTPDIDSRDVNLAFDPDARRAQQDWSDYLKTRPYRDEDGHYREGSGSEETQEKQQNPIDKGIFEGDVFHNRDTEGIFSVSATRTIGGKKVYRVTTELPTKSGRIYRASHELSEEAAKDYLSKQAGELIEPGHDRRFADETTGEFTPGVAKDTSVESDVDDKGKPFNIAEAANDPGIDEGTRKVLRDLDELLNSKPQKALEAPAASAVEAEAQKLVNEVNDLEAQGRLTPEQRAQIKEAVEGVISDIDAPLNAQADQMDVSRIHPIPEDLMGVTSTEAEDYPELEGDQVIREGESQEEYEARIGAADVDESIVDSDSSEYIKVEPIPEELIGSGDQAENIEPTDPTEGAEFEVDPDSERIMGIHNQWTEYMLREHKDIMDERVAAREEFLKIMAKSQKGHLRRIKTGGFVEGNLRTMFGRIGGNKLADFLTKPTTAEKAAGDRYAEALAKIDSARHDFMGHEYDNGNMSREEIKASRALYMTKEHADNTKRIADLQKEDGGKPMNKWWRRAGYAGAAVTGGLLALTPLGWIGGLAAAGVGAGAIRVNANKRNANLEGESVLGGGNFIVDGIAEYYGRRFVTEMNSGARVEEGREVSADDIVNAHYDETSNEIGKNRGRLLRPVMGAVAAAAVVKGFGDFMTSSATYGTLEANDHKFDPPETKESSQPPAVEEPPKPDPTPELQGREFTVESGNGYTHELQDFAEVNGESLSGDEAYRLHLELQDKFGPDYMDINGPGNDIYYEGGDTRLAEPGAAKWKEGVPEYIDQWMASR